MKKLVLILGMCLIGFAAQAATQDFEAAVAEGAGLQGNKDGKHFDTAKLSALIQKHLAERQEELQRATTKGHMDIVAALQKVITDLNQMQTALTNKDRAAFKAANEQRRTDREALEQLRKTDKRSHSKKTS